MRPAPASARLGPAQVAMLVFVGSALCAAALTLAHQRANEEAAAQSFALAADRTAAYVDERVRRYEYGLRAARGVVIGAGATGIDRAHFRAYMRSRATDQEFPGARGFGIIRRVARGRERDFELGERADGAPSFTISELAPHSHERFVIQHIEPIDRNRQAVGLDIASEANRRRAALRALRSGRATLTAPITLVQASGRPLRSFLFLLPIYEAPEAPQTPAARYAAGVGWSYAPLLIDEVLADVDLEQGGLALRIRDTREEEPFFTSAGAEDVAAEGLVRRAELHLYGRVWELEVRSTASFVPSLRQFSAQSVALIALCITLLLTALSYIVALSRRANSQLVMEQARRAEIVQNSPDAIVGASVDGVVTDWNRGAQDLFGYTASEALGHSLGSLIVPEAERASHELLLGSVASGAPLRDVDAVRVGADGQPREVSFSIAPIFGAQGRVVGTVHTLRDVGESRRAAREIKALNANLELQVQERTAMHEAARRDLETVLDSVPTAIGYWDAELVCRVANRAHDSFFDLDGQRVVGGHMRGLLGQSAFERDRAHFEAVLRGEPQRFERTVTVRDGSVRHGSVHLVPDLQDGKARGFYAIEHDITSAKTLELELRETWTLLSSVLDAASEVSIIATDPDLTIKLFNTGAEHLLGYRAEAVVGKTTPIMIHDEAEIDARAAELTRRLGRAVAGGAVFTEESSFYEPREWTYVRKDGSRLPVSLVVTPMQTDDGELLGYLGVAHDVTQQKAVEASLRDAAAQARSASAAKSQFLANMSHEIRTPMNAVIGLSHILSHTQLTPDQADCLDKLTVASNSLRSLIDDILDLSKIEANELRLEREPLDLRALVSDLEELMRVSAEAKGIQLDVDPSEDLPRVVLGDRTRLQQVLSNLLSNAIKFTERGGVQVRAALVTEPGTSAEGKARVRFTVRDSGIGIGSEDQKRLFEPFAQADYSTTRRFGGTGLGLSIVRRLVDLMGGRVGVTSALGLGSEFWIEVDLEVASGPALGLTDSSAAACDLEGAGVLVVDDSTINLEVARRTLELAGACVQVARDGREALELLRVGAEHVDLILMDVQMPVMDGREATRRIRGELGLTLPIIALSAGALDSEHALAREAGMDDFVSKPFDPVLLVERVAHHLGVTLESSEREVRDTSPVAASLDLPGVDTKSAIARLGGDQAKFMSLLESFRASIRAFPNQRSADLQAQAAQAHKLKGSAGLLGAMGLHRAAQKVEEACRRGDELRARRAMTALCQEVATFVADLDEALGTAPLLSAPSQDPPQQALSLDVVAVEVGALLAALDTQDLAAQRAFRALTPRLRILLGPGVVASVTRDLDNLAFAAAADTLRRHAPWAAPHSAANG